MTELERAVALLKAGELVAFPTETVYGLGADAANPEGVRKIFAAKGRPADHPVIVHLARGEDMTAWAADIPPLAWRLSEIFWPGPLTLILKKQPWVSSLVTGGQESVGLRVPAHPLAQALLTAFAAVSPGIGRGGIAAPSANRFGRVSPTTAAHVREELGDRLACILDGGPAQVGIESTILDLTRLADEGPVILRPGGIPAERLCQLFRSFAPGEPRKPFPAASAAPAVSPTPRVSGSLASHYAPATSLHLCPGAELSARLARESAAGRRCGVMAWNAKGNAEVGGAHLWRILPASPEGYAHDLYATLRELDAARCDAIIAELPPDTPEWQAIHDRLRRASHETHPEKISPRS
ncbi:MAG: threonylcarbamoyl-AMP synthase [Zoogloeaceae bacterium]|jgi:L-threonylcarbamoyladenylate synthase|nr:threonylcarbamoyl-AMP synthase [Zoogloeaceae bacterium]